MPQDVPIVAALFAGIRLSLRHIDGQIEWGQHDQISMDVVCPFEAELVGLVSPYADMNVISK